MIHQISIGNLRCFKSTELEAVAGVNVIVGESGAGKTSVLEAMHLLCSGVSHRGHGHRALLHEDSELCQVSGQLGRADHALFDVSLQRRRDQNYQLIVNGEREKRLNALAGLCPLRILSLENSLFFESEPAARRNLLDWHLFHAQQRDFPLADFRRIVAQRNAALKQAGGRWNTTLDILSEQFAELAKRIDTARQTLVHNINLCLAEQENSQDYTIVYRSGFDQQKGVSDALRECRSQDLNRGFTHIGPQRADMQLHYQGRAAVGRCSRGQLLRGLLFLNGALIALLPDDSSCVLGIDDLTAMTGDWIAQELLQWRRIEQIWCTVTGAPAQVDNMPADAVFHVKHNQVFRLR